MEERARDLWRMLPESLVNSTVGVRAKRVAGRRWHGAVLPDQPPPTGGETAGDHRVVRTLEELDETIAFLEQAWAVSDDELRRGFLTFHMEPQLDMPSDPYSDEYRRSVLGLYEWLHGKPYAPVNEMTTFDLEYCINVPFPYTTQSGSTVGNHLMAIGHVIRTLDLPPKSRVLEFGAGWGNITLALAQMGHHVTAVDIGPNFVELIKARASRMGIQVEAVVGDFSMIHQLEGRYDAVLFFESFHHCADHLDLLAGLDRVVVAGGRVLFAGEPIQESWPVPWGLRFDGESVWAIRKHGWLELGFRRSYFLEALQRCGWGAEVVSCPWANAGEVYVARRAFMRPA